jgi:hypothetical protein
MLFSAALLSSSQKSPRDTYFGPAWISISPHSQELGIIPGGDLLISLRLRAARQTKDRHGASRSSFQGLSELRPYLCWPVHLQQHRTLQFMDRNRRIGRLR